VSRRASLPGADELFRRTSSDRGQQRETDDVQGEKSTKLQVAPPQPAPEPQTAAPPVATRKAPRHDEKITFYCTRDELMALERVRLELRASHGVAADRGRIVRAALGYVLEDFEARAEDSILIRRLAP